MTLKDIALELLEKYQTSETYCIWEFSGKIEEGEKWLSSEVEKYKALIETSADVVERKKGEWEEIEVIANAYDINGIKTWASKMMCDQCGFTTIAIEGHFSQYNFCPNCGADMRGDKDE